MALQIIENNKVFYVKGKINTSTERCFMYHFDSVLNKSKKIIINMDAVDEIDTDGVRALKPLISIAKRKDKTFYITGKGSKEIYEDYQSNQVG